MITFQIHKQKTLPVVRVADAEAGTEEGEEVKLDKHQQAELEKTMEECDTRLGEIREAVQSNLWPRYGKEEVDSAIQEAENACDIAQASPITAINRDATGYQLSSSVCFLTDHSSAQT